MQIVIMAIGIASLVCWIMVLVKIFQAGQIWQGVVGIICPLFALIWGWMKAPELGTAKIMPIWTGLVVIQIILSLVFRPTVATTMAPPGIAHPASIVSLA